MDDLVGLIDFVAAYDLVANVDPVQYSVRLLGPWFAAVGRAGHDGPPGKLRPGAAGLDMGHPDPVVDYLQVEVAALVEAQVGEDPERTFDQVDGWSVRTRPTHRAPRSGSRFRRSS